MANEIIKIIEDLNNPDKEFTPIPFWFLNDELTDDEIIRQMEDFCDKGVYGVVLHPRIGIPESIPYLSDRFMHYIKVATETAHRLGMYIVLYDEAMYPSGSAHGLVVKENPNFAAQAIVLSDSSDEGKLIAECKSGKYILQLRSEGTIRGIHIGEDDGEKNAPPAADLLSHNSVNAFIRITHQRYFDVVGEYFGNTIIGFFTDEPSILGRCARPDCFAWTWDFENDFTEAGGILEELEGLFLNIENDSTRLYRKMIFERELNVYYNSLRNFCQSHGIALMGHPHSGDDIECERYFDIPGQDMVLRWIAPEKDALSGRESAQGKCSSDAARISGARRNSNECFGVCVRDNIPWYFTGSDMKWYIDYLGVRGVNMFIPHAFYYSIRGARKDERPPDVGPNNIWWEHYNKISTYMKRISYIMTDSRNEARVAVMCENRDMRIERVKELYRNQIEFNYLPYSDFSTDMIADNALRVAENAYEFIYCDDKNAIAGVKKINSIDDLPYRDLYTDLPCPDLRVSRIVKNGVKMMFITNEGTNPVKAEAAIDERTTLIAYDLYRGKAYRKESKIRDNKTHFKLSLEPFESLLLIFDNDNDLSVPKMEEKRYLDVKFSLTLEDKERYVKTYQGTLKISNDIKESLWIRVDAEEMVECFVNGCFADVSLWRMHEFNLTSLLKEGDNTVLLKVTGNASNRFTDFKTDYGLL